MVRCIQKVALILCSSPCRASSRTRSESRRRGEEVNTGGNTALMPSSYRHDTLGVPLWNSATFSEPSIGWRWTGLIWKVCVSHLRVTPAGRVRCAHSGVQRMRGFARSAAYLISTAPISGSGFVSSTSTMRPFLSVSCERLAILHQ